MKLLSVHVPRTGGHSLMANLYDAFGPWAFTNDHQHDPIFYDYQGPPMEFPDDKVALHGNMRPDMYVGHDTLVTFLRHPVDMVIGFHGILREITEPERFPFLQRFHDERPSVVEFAQWDKVSALLSETYFGGFDMRSFDFIGTYENRLADLERLGTMLGVSLNPDLHRNAREDPLVVTDAERSELHRILAADISFYAAHVSGK